MNDGSWVKVCRADEVEFDEPRQVMVDGVAIGLYRLQDGCHALGDVCTHAFAHLTDGFVEDDIVECPLHHARYEIRTGKSLDGIAPSDLASYAVKVEDGDVYVQMTGATNSREGGDAPAEPGDDAIADTVLDLLQRDAEADEWRGVLAPQAEFEVLNGHLSGCDAVASRLGDTPTGHLVWKRLHRPGFVLAGEPRTGSGDRGMALMLAIENGLVLRVSQQNLAMPPRPATPMVMDAALRERIDTSLAAKHPIALSYVDPEGRPHLSLRGSLRSFGDDRLAMWARSADTGLAAAIRSNPQVALLYRDEETRATYQLSGRAHVGEDEPTRRAVYDAMPKVERDHDFAMLGAAIIIELDLVEGWAGIGRTGPIDPVRLVRT